MSLENIRLRTDKHWKADVEAEVRDWHLRNVNDNRLSHQMFRLEVFTAFLMNTVVFWHMTPCSLLICHQRAGEACYPHCQNPSITIETEAARLSSVLITNDQSTRGHIPGDCTLRSNRCQSKHNWDTSDTEVSSHVNAMSALPRLKCQIMFRIL
jgi:hypothetical protein